ncbi:DUF2064 domain-containing protein [Halorhabdus salina]|uniref:DUF2064 domain-containing protein n=1 Tax=Halorhabdus salina TaxID=2750670 RepID=UPI0015EF274A|nr:DUF2064 domain-containing protein [Halorhabdus salina]
MATVVVRVDRPVPGETLPALATATPLTDAEAATLYRRALQDVCGVIEESGASLLVTYPSTDGDGEGPVREAVVPGLDDPSEGRFEPQVGSTPAARMGNTVTHLLEEEDESSVAVLDPTAVLATRSTIDQAAMKLRSSAVVVGPAAAGGIYYAGFTDTLDFDGIDRQPMVETIVERATDAELSADVLAPSPTLSTVQDLQSAVPILRARRQAGLPVPERTSQYLADLDLRVTAAEATGVEIKKS